MASVSASRMAICSDAVATRQCSWRCLTVLAASVSVLMQSLLCWFSFASSSSLWKYRSMTSRTLAGSILKFLGTIDVLMSPLGCRNP